MKRTAIHAATALVLLFALPACARAHADKSMQNTLQSTCPSMFAWQKVHPHPESDNLVQTHDPHASNKALQKQLLDLYVADEQAGTAWADEVDKPQPDPKVLAKLRTVRRHNLNAIESIIHKYGFPSTKQVGRDGVWAAFGLVQHADDDPSFQRSVLAALEKLYRQKAIPGEVYAYLADRTRVADKRKQLFGTQFELLGNDLVIRPVEDPAHLDQRRKQADLPTMTDYLCYITYRSGKKARLSP